MINSHLLYRLSYRGTATRILLINKGKSSLGRASPGVSENLGDRLRNRR